METIQFWEARARRFAADGAGLKAVCSYAMPDFYNWAIDVTQRTALRGLLKSIPHGARVLDYGCGVGRWTQLLAARGCQVTAVDFSPAMLAEAQRRTTQTGVADRCRFIQSDVTTLELTDRFDVILGVTVLQHVLDDKELSQTIARLGRHLRPGGRLIMVEAAPHRRTDRCDTATFHARSFASYRENIVAAGLYLQELRGIDPSPLKLWVVPRFRRWPKPFAVGALLVATVLSLPVDLLLAGMLTRRSWHKVMVCRGGRQP